MSGCFAPVAVGINAGQTYQLRRLDVERKLLLLEILQQIQLISVD